MPAAGGHSGLPAASDAYGSLIDSADCRGTRRPHCSIGSSREMPPTGQKRWQIVRSCGERWATTQDLFLRCHFRFPSVSGDPGIGELRVNTEVSTNYFAWFRTTQRVTPMAPPAGIQRSIFPIAIPSAVPAPVRIDMLTAKPSGILVIPCLVRSRDQFPRWPGESLPDSAN